MSKEEQTIMPLGIPSSTHISSPTLSARENIEHQLFVIAKEHAEIAARDIDRNDPEKTRMEMKNSIIAIVMSYTALEAFSIDIYNRLTQNDYDSNEFKTFDSRELNSKWEHLSHLAYQQKNNTNEKRALPRSVTKQLIELNDIRDQIIHYKPKPESLDTLGRFPDNSPINPEFILFTSVEATKAIETVRNVLITFKEVTGYDVPKLE